MAHGTIGSRGRNSIEGTRMKVLALLPQTEQMV